MLDWTQTLLEVRDENEDKGLGLSIDQMHVEAVRRLRAYLIVQSLPGNVRKALQASVKSGELCRLPKDKERGLCEVFYHPNFEHIAKGRRVELREQELRHMRIAKRSAFCPL